MNLTWIPTVRNFTARFPPLFTQSNSKESLNRYHVRFKNELQNLYHLNKEDTSEFRTTLARLKESEKQQKQLWIAVINFHQDKLKRGEIIAVIDEVETSVVLSQRYQPANFPFIEECHDEISENEAQALFRFVNGYSTKLNDQSLNDFDSIPFTFVNTGCVQRAHKMAQLIVVHSKEVVKRCVQPAKIWAFGDLKIDSPNLPLGRGGMGAARGSDCQNRRWISSHRPRNF